MKWYEKRRNIETLGGGAIRNGSYMGVWKLTKFPTHRSPRLPPRMGSSFLTLQKCSLPDLIPSMVCMRNNAGTYGKAVQGYIPGSFRMFFRRISLKHSGRAHSGQARHVLRRATRALLNKAFLRHFIKSRLIILMARHSHFQLEYLVYVLVKITTQAGQLWSCTVTDAKRNPQARIKVARSRSRVA